MTGQQEFSLLVGYGTDMGNAEDAAFTFTETLQASGIEAEPRELNQIDVAELQTVTHFVVVTSTFGDGEFPDNATLFWEAISADTARLEHLSFAVLALGDSGYDLFCHAGRLVDERLEALGATRLADRVDIDGAYEQAAKAWTTDVVKLLTAEYSSGTAKIAAAGPDTTPPARQRNQTAEARLIVNRRLTAPDSDRDVRHYELDLTGTGITYQAGDSIAIEPDNDPVLVDAILAELGVEADHPVSDQDEPLGVLLTRHFEIRTPSRALRTLAAARTRDKQAVAALNGDVAPRAGSWLYGKDVLDVIRLGRLTVDEVVDTLRPLQSRDYSIASSPLVHPDRVHLTVATVRYHTEARRYGGVASTFLADRGETLRVHLRPNHAFRLPADDVPIVMVGPGTGIAPFRAFLQERQATGAKGGSWLFFGDRRRATDFLCGDELSGFVESGTLTRLDLAFSRDHPTDSKTYVQHRMWENRAELFRWLHDGAHLYVCGDAERMAKDVDGMLHTIVESCGDLDSEAAHAYVNDLIRTHRYVRDVY